MITDLSLYFILHIIIYHYTFIIILYPALKFIHRSFVIAKGNCFDFLYYCKKELQVVSVIKEKLCSLLPTFNKLQCCRVPVNLQNSFVISGFFSNSLSSILPGIIQNDLNLIIASTNLSLCSYHLVSNSHWNHFQELVIWIVIYAETFQLVYFGFPLWHPCLHKLDSPRLYHQ